MESVIPKPPPPFPGQRVVVGEKEWIVPSLTSGEVVRLERGGFLARIEAATVVGVLVEKMGVVKQALKHNYLDLKDEELDVLSPATIEELYRAVWRATWGNERDLLLKFARAIAANEVDDDTVAHAKEIVDRAEGKIPEATSRLEQEQKS